MVSDLDSVLGALRAPARREILGLIWDRELPAGEIAATFALSAPTISEHLGVLRRAGLVEVTRVGTSRRYRAKPDALEGLHGALEGSTKWLPASDPGERGLTELATRSVVVASVDVTTDPQATFSAFVDPRIYSRWLGAPVSIVDGRFAATMEWGTEVRGTYDLVVPPELIVMQWDFDDFTVPVPGRPMTAYLRVWPARRGSRVEVHQLVDSAAQVDFMNAAWGVVLSRLKKGVAAATDPAVAVPARPKRNKHKSSA